MIKRTRVLDRFGREVEDDVCPDGGSISVSLMFVDARAGEAVPPPGKYFLRDKCGRVAGLGDVATAMKARQAQEAYTARLANAHKKGRLTDKADAEPMPTGLTPSQLAHWQYTQRLANAHRKYR